jgi:2-aminoadipate transaminase
VFRPKSADHLALSELGRRIEAPPISWLMSTALAHPHLISLAAGFTDNPSLPVAEARALFEELLGSSADGQAALQYGTTSGDPQLRELTSRRLGELDESADSGLYDPDRMLLTNGSQQLLYMVTEALCDPGDIVLVEDPTYFVYLGILQSFGVRARGVRMEKEGLDTGQLERVLEEMCRSGQIKRLKFLYLVSYHQNPTGATTSLERKAAALEILGRYEKAAGHRIYLLEDAAYRELRFQGSPIRSALALKHGNSRVIYAGTYSKPFATGTRVGFGLLPEPVFTAVWRIKGNHDFGSSHLLQKLLARALSSGVYEEHLAALRARYQAKARVMLEALEEHFPPGADWWTPQGGLYYWARLPGKRAAGPRSAFFKRALAKDVLYVPGELCYADDPARKKPAHEMRLSFGAASEANIREGIRRLGEAMKV